MPSPEYAIPSQSVDQRLDGQAAPATSPRLQAVITHLATASAVDLAQSGAQLNFDIPSQQQRWLIGNIDGERIGVTRCQMDSEGLLSPDLDMVFTITPDGWEPQELMHSDQVWQAYTHAKQAAGEPVTDAHGDFNFADFADFTAQDLAQHCASLESR